MVTQARITRTFSITSASGLPLNWEQIAMPINAGIHTAIVNRICRRPTRWVIFMAPCISSARRRKWDRTAEIMALLRSWVSSCTRTLMTRSSQTAALTPLGTLSTVWKILSSALSERSRFSSGDGSSVSSIWPIDLNVTVPIVGFVTVVGCHERDLT